MFTQIARVRPQTPILDQIEQPAELKSLSKDQLEQLSHELRAYLLYAAGQTGGHFGANLGVVELTLALHRVFDTPHDQLVWDVGHQAYVHKVLTGRRDQLLSIRSKGGLAAFPSRDESIYDTFGVGHSSTSISAALGMALAARQLKTNQRVVCVIGDGAMTAGMAFEALNDAVDQQADLMVILNDNDMSISSSTGGFSKHLARLWKNGLQYDIGDDGEPELKKRPSMSYVRVCDDSNMPDNLFRALGFKYYGPFDGHDLHSLVSVFERLKDLKGPRLVHVYTRKGKGFAPAESDPIGFHAIAKLDAVSDKPSGMKFSDVFGRFLLDTAHDKRLMAVTPAMCEGSGMKAFSLEYPEQFIDVAIAEQHAVTLAGGMAVGGLKPIVAIYSTFLQRAYDQLVHDIALQKLDVTFAIDRAGLVGEDGATHAGIYDFGFMRSLPDALIMAPIDELECYDMLATAYEYPGLASVRYPRGYGRGAKIDRPAQMVPRAAKTLKSFDQPDAVILGFGTLTLSALKASELLEAQGIKLAVVNMRFVKPLDTDLLDQFAHLPLITIEEHAISTGAGSAVNEYLCNQSGASILNLGIPDRIIAHGSHEEQLKDCGLDPQSIAQRISHWLNSLNT